MIPSDITLPERAITEQEWQSALRLVLPRLVPVLLFRQIPGKHRHERGAWMQGAPVGAADLTGWAKGGLRIELECKYGAGKTTSEQQRWLDVALSWGVVAFVARYETTDTLATNVLRVASALAIALSAEGPA